MSVFESELVDLGLDVDSLDARELFEGFVLDFVVKVTNVSDDGVVLHLLHVGSLDDVLVSSGGDEDVHSVDDVFDGDYFVAFHTGLKGADGVDFGDVDSGSGSSHGLGASLSDISETADKYFLSADHDVSGSVESVDQGVLAAVDVVELGLGYTVVDVNEGAPESAFALELVESGHTGGGFFGDSFQVLGELGEEVLVLFETVVDGLEQVVLVLRVSSDGVDELSCFLILLFSLEAVDAQQRGISSVIDDEVGSLSVSP